MSPLDVLLWVAVPYAVAAVFVVGHVWRYRYDQFGWTTRSSQLYENRWLRLGSPLFHVGILMVIVGHVVGILVPRPWLEAVGVDEHAYHLVATIAGTFAAILTVVGLVILVLRRRLSGAVFRVTTRTDKLMYVVLGAAIGFGTLATVQHQIFGGGYDYRGSISPWFRSLLTFQPDPSLMADVPLAFQLHVLCGLALFALWPFTRLVHVFSAPLGYLTRPYVVYRRRAVATTSRAPRRGWEPPTAP
ncbi:respiratory nitrate reductase subunit gamma [Cellulosimicrobium sp. NPDC057862]|uniref:respiratory nitrate reductase subunit gamma n=1 Tax=Cellulosimicrobium sp. NPDC057862 TaxID=3346266 RepID=UPI003671CBBD